MSIFPCMSFEVKGEMCECLSRSQVILLFLSSCPEIKKCKNQHLLLFFVFYQTLTDVRAKEGSSVILECVVKGEPEPQVQWLREDIPVDPSPDFDMIHENGKCTMHIHEIYVDDAGKFSCTATNAAGTVTTSCQLFVEGEFD